MIAVTVEAQERQAAEVALKRRKNRRPDAPTATHEAAQGHVDAMRDDDVPEDSDGATKTYRQRGARQGPGTPLVPGHPQPCNDDRGYVGDGHAAPSPQQGAPRADPIPLRVPGLVESVALPDAPRGQNIDYRVTAALALGSPSEQ
jgi:hypothetical protein